jgi:hypothetical protein
VPGKHHDIDIISNKERNFGEEMFWALIVHDYTDHCWIFAMKNSLDLKEKIKTLLTDLRSTSINKRFIRCDDDGKT